MKKYLLAIAVACGAISASADITVSDSKTLETLTEPAEISAKGILHLTSKTPLGENAAVIIAAGGMVTFESLPCSKITADMLAKITLEGRAYDPAKDRLAVYGNGSAIVADGCLEPLTIYNAANCTGEKMVCDIDIYYRGTLLKKENYLEQISLDAFDNNIRSFRLKKGYSCTFANNPDGTGFSRNFVAAEDDIVFDEMPEGLEFASFIRVCRYDWPGKRGWSGGGTNHPELTRSSWYYSWGASDESPMDYQFIPMRHNRWWDGWDKIGSRTNTSCVLGFNEPDHDDQANMGVNRAIDMWPEMMKSGLRIGSPAPDAINKQWLKDFLKAADSLNYRVDFVATHMYWNSQTPTGLTDNINNLCEKTYGGRPMWITEWNNGANWTHETWPDKEGKRRDAEFNILLDEDGNETTVSRPHTEANSAKQTEWLAAMLQAFDDCKWLERHSIYNWVEDARSVVLDVNVGKDPETGKTINESRLTPAGKVFEAFNSRPGFRSDAQYIHTCRAVPPVPKQVLKNASRIRIDLLDTNGETAKGYVAERRFGKGTWEEVGSIEYGVDYKYGKTCSFIDRDMTPGTREYRFKAIYYKDGQTKSINSRRVKVEIEAAGIADVADTEGIRFYARDGKLCIESDVDGCDTIYRIDGTVARNISYSADCVTEIDDLSRGIYIFRGRKAAL